MLHENASEEGFDLTRRMVLRVVLPTLVVLNFLNALAIVRYEQRGEGRFFATFSFDREANVPSWFSSALLLFTALLLALVAVRTKRDADPWARHWAGLSLIYTGLSLDETASIHEYIGSRLRAAFDLHGLLYYAGVIPMLVLAVSVAIVYFRFLLALPRATRLGVVVAAGIYVGGAVGLEAPAGWWSGRHGGGSLELLIVSSVEENLELIGTTAFIVVVLAWAAGRYVILRAER